MSNYDSCMLWSCATPVLFLYEKYVILVANPNGRLISYQQWQWFWFVFAAASPHLPTFSQIRHFVQQRVLASSEQFAGSGVSGGRVRRVRSAGLLFVCASQGTTAFAYHLHSQCEFRVRDGTSLFHFCGPIIM